MRTKLDIINSSFRKCAVAQVASLETKQTQVQAALSAYDFVLQNVLRDYAWGFAKRYATLAKMEESPPFGYRNAYLLPKDCFRLLDCRESEDFTNEQAKYEVVGDAIYTDAELCNVRYITNNVLVELWSIDFANAFATRLAAEISLTIAQNMQLQQQLFQLYQMELDKAMVNDNAGNNEKELDKYTSSKLLQERMG